MLPGSASWNVPLVTATFVATGTQTGASRFDAVSRIYVCPPVPVTLTPNWLPTIPAPEMGGGVFRVRVAAVLVAEP